MARLPTHFTWFRTPRAAVAALAAILLWALLGEEHEERNRPAYFDSISREAPVLTGRVSGAPTSKGFVLPVRCKMQDGTPVPSALVRVWRAPHPRGARRPMVVMGTWSMDGAGEADVYVRTEDVPARRSYDCRFMAVHPTIPGLTVNRRNAMGPPPSGEASAGWAYELIFPGPEPGVEGIVLDEGNNPVSGALVDWTDAEGNGTASLLHRTTKHGHFSIPRHGKLGHLRIQAKLFEPRVLGVPLGQEFVRVILSQRPHTTGRIVDERGDPIEGAKVSSIVHGEAELGATPRLRAEAWDYWLARQGYSESGSRGGTRRTWSYQRTETTSRSGRFAIPSATIGTSRIVVKAPGYGTLVRELPPGDLRSDFGEVVLHRSPLAGAYGTLVFADGTPAANAKIMFTRPPLDETQVHLGTRTTDEQGRFELDGLPEGEEVVLGIRVKSGVRGKYMQRRKIERDMVVEY